MAHDLVNARDRHQAVPIHPERPAEVLQPSSPIHAHAEDRIHLASGDPAHLIDRAASELTAKYFLPHHAVIFRTIMKLRQRGHPVDLITVAQRLKDNDELERIGGASGLTEIFVYLPDAANYPRYVGVLKEAAKL